MPESSGLVCELIEFELLTLTENCEESSLNYQFKDETMQHIQSKIMKDCIKERIDRILGIPALFKLRNILFYPF